jgi:hypothetical protein
VVRCGEVALETQERLFIKLAVDAPERPVPK